jgi:hypothetical protein
MWKQQLRKNSRDTSSHRALHELYYNHMTSPIETKVYRDPKEFLAACGSLMSSDPVKNSLPLSLISRHISDPQQPPPSLMLVGQQNGKGYFYLPILISFAVS